MAFSSGPRSSGGGGSTSGGSTFTAAEKTKLGTVERNAAADQTGAEIKAAYEGEADTNAFTNAEKTKLTGIETGATADQTGAQIKTAYENQNDTNAFTNAEKTKLATVETNAAADQTGAQIKTAYEAESDTNAYTDSEKTKLGNLRVNRQLPSLPSTGSRDGKIPKFNGNTLQWLADAEGSGGGMGGTIGWQVTEVYDRGDTYSDYSGDTLVEVTPSEAFEDSDMLVLRYERRLGTNPNYTYLSGSVSCIWSLIPETASTNAADSVGHLLVIERPNSPTSDSESSVLLRRRANGSFAWLVKSNIDDCRVQVYRVSSGSGSSDSGGGSRQLDEVYDRGLYSGITADTYLEATFSEPFEDTDDLVLQAEREYGTPGNETYLSAVTQVPWRLIADSDSTLAGDDVGTSLVLERPLSPQADQSTAVVLRKRADGSIGYLMKDSWASTRVRIYRSHGGGGSSAEAERRIEAIAFDDSATSTSGVSTGNNELTPVSTTPISVVQGSGAAEILSGVSGNDFTVAAGLYMLRVVAECACAGEAAPQVRVRLASDNSVIAPTDVLYVRSTGGGDTFLPFAFTGILRLAADTEVNLHLHRHGRGIDLQNISVEFIKM